MVNLGNEIIHFLGVVAKLCRVEGSKIILVFWFNVNICMAFLGPSLCTTGNLGPLSKTVWNRWRILISG